MSELKGKCTNRPDMQFFYDALCEIRGRQDGGEIEYTHNTTLKEEYKDAG